MLGAVLVIVGLGVAIPWQRYLAQLAEQHRQEQAVAELTAELDNLNEQKLALSDPAYLKQLARQRLQYVKPGDTVYVVQAPTQALPAETAAAAGSKNAPPRPWYEKLWSAVSDPTTQTGQPPASGGAKK